MKISWIFDTGFRYENENRAPGWAVPMGSMLIPTITCIIFLQFGVQPGWPVTAVAAIDSLVASACLRVHLARVWKRGFRGMLRGGTWIELAAACWVIWASAFCFSGVARLRPLQLAVWQQGMLSGSDLLIQYLAPIAIGCSLTGFLLGLFRRRPVHGPAMHVVAFFFWSALLIFGGMAVIPQNAGWAVIVAEIIGILGVTALIAAGVLAVIQKKSHDLKSQEEHR